MFIFHFNFLEKKNFSIESIEAFLSPKGEKIKGSWRLKEVKKLKKQASKPPSSRNLTAKEDYPTEDKVFVIGKFRLFVFKPGAKV